MTSDYFIGYPKKSKGYGFLCPTHNLRIVETGNAKFIENGKVSRAMKDVMWNEIREIVTIYVNVPLSTHTPNIVHVVRQNTNNSEQHSNEDMPCE